MIYILIALLISLNVNAAEIRNSQSMDHSSDNQTALQNMLSKGSETSTSNAILSTIALFKQLVVHIPKNEYAFGLEAGVGAKYPEVDQWVQWQITGQKDKLVSAHQKCLTDKSKVAQRKRVTLEHILNNQMTDAMADIVQGSKQDAEKALKAMRSSRELYELNEGMGIGSVPGVKTIELVTAERIYQSRFDVGPQNDMVITTQDVFYETSKELFAELDASKFKSDAAYVAEVMKGIEWMKGIGMFNLPDDQKMAKIKSIFKGINYSSRRFQQRMKVDTALYILDSTIESLYPMVHGKSLKQNLHDAVYKQRPHLGHKLDVLYHDDIMAFFDVATDCILLVKNHVISSLKMGAAIVDMGGNFAMRLDNATEKIYEMRMKERMNAQK